VVKAMIGTGYNGDDGIDYDRQEIKKLTLNMIT